MAVILAKVLGYERFSYPFFENTEGDVICFAQGHLFEIDHNNPIYDDWSNPHAFNSLPRALHMKPTDDYEVRVKSRKVSTATLRERIPQLMQEHDVIVNAMDIDREGERIFYDLFNVAQTTATIYRVDLSRGITRSLIQEAFDNAFCGSVTKAQSYASQARAYGDFGFALLTVVTTYYGRQQKLHPLLGGYTDSIQSVVSVGRVIVPALALIAKRCREVENIKDKYAYLPKVTGSVLVDDKPCKVEFTYDYKRLGFSPSLLNDRKLAQRYVESKSTHDLFIIEDVSQSKGFVSAPDLFDTPSIQAEMGDLSPSETMNALQSLYEKGLITYPRTDDSDVPESVKEKDSLTSVFESLKANFDTVSDRTTKASVNFLEKQSSVIKSSQSHTHEDANSNEIAHTAIIPTHAKANISQLTDNELNVYKAVCNRFTDHLQGGYHVCQLAVTGRFKSDFTGMLGESDASYTMAIPVKTNADGQSGNRYLKLSSGDEIQIDTISCIQHSLECPLYYRESDIPLAMRQISETVSDPDKKDLLEKCKGLGSAATRDDITASLLKRSYIEITMIEDRRCVVVTSKGLALLSVLPQWMTSPITTALWEAEFYKIEQCRDHAQARQLRDNFVLNSYQRIERYISHLNQQYERGHVARCNVKPSPSLLAKLKQRARTLQLQIPTSILSSTKLAQSWLDSHPIRHHSTTQSQLENSGLAMNGDVERDARRVALRASSLTSSTSNPPTQKSIIRAAKLATIVGTKMPKKAKESAKECAAFIQLCENRRTPTPDQISTLKKLSAQSKVPIDGKMYKSRKETQKMILRLRKALSDRK